MNEEQLKRHLEKFRPSCTRRGPYLLEVECPNSSTGLWLKDGMLAWAICETAFKSRAAKSIRLLFFRDKHTEEILFDTEVEEHTVQMEESLKRKAEKQAALSKPRRSRTIPRS